MEHTLDVEDIRALLPHRYPMLLVDRILEMQPGERVVGLKNVTINEPFFQGHFPGEAVMPGVLILEAMAQVANLMLLSQAEHQGKTAFLAGVDKVQFKQPVIPGDTLIIEAIMIWLRSNIGKVKLIARVEGKVVTEGEIMFALRIREPNQVQAKLRRLFDEGKKEGENGRD